MINDQLDGMGLILRRGSLIDATLVKAQRRAGGDPDADWTVRGKKAHYGYKAHLTVDHKSELIRNLDLTAAGVHESTKFVEMICGDERSVFADKAYSKDGRKSVLRDYGVFCGILDKARRGQPLSAKQKKRNKRFARIRCAVERPIATFKRCYEWVRVRYVGLVRNRAHLFLTGICYNLKKMAALVQRA